MRLFYGVFLLLFLQSCSSEYDKHLKISATTWIGYTPLFYAEAKGWLKPLNIKLLNVTSLAENMYLYQAGKSDAYTGTQYEYGILKDDMPSLRPIMMFDQSNGGDLIMSNFSLKELQESNQTIDIYLEMDSINSVVLHDFLNSYKLSKKEIQYFNKDQTQIRNLKKRSNPTIVVTYVPYNVILSEHGFKEIASTKENLQLIVVDAMFATSEIYEQHTKQFQALKKSVNRAVDALYENPKEFYLTIKPYILDMSYEEFEASLDRIIWVHKNITPALSQRLKNAGFPTEELLQ